MGREAARTAIEMLHAPVCPSGVMPVAIGNGFGGVIFHEACGHGLEATSVAFGTSVFCGKLGEQIASPCVTAVDDGTLPNEWGSENVDDEGTPTTKLVLIEKRRAEKLHDRPPERQAHGHAAHRQRPARELRLRAHLAHAQHLHCRRMRRRGGDHLLHGRRAVRRQDGRRVRRSATGEFNFAVQEGYLVKDGKITTPVRGASLIGKGADILMKIDRVGRDMRMAQGMCGSLSGSVPTNVGQPMIRVSSITVGGRA